jgi:hypothetical protein
VTSLCLARPSSGIPAKATAVSAIPMAVVSA